MTDETEYSEERIRLGLARLLTAAVDASGRAKCDVAADARLHKDALRRVLQGERSATVGEALVECDVCGNVDTTNPCGICADPRRDGKGLCVVEDVADLWALDRAKLFTGKYHVLGGKLSALDGIRPEDLNIASLLSRVEEGGVDEVVLAMNATLEGQTTAHYLAERLGEYPVRITQLAHGLPVGGELDYLDEGTLAQALRARRPLG